MADVWSIKGITPAEREGITKAAAAADVPIGRFIVRACLALDATQPRPERDVEQAYARFERMARLAHDISGSRGRAAQVARRTLWQMIQTEATTLTAGLPPLPARPIIEGKAHAQIEAPPPQLGQEQPASGAGGE